VVAGARGVGVLNCEGVSCEEDVVVLGHRYFDSREQELEWKSGILSSAGHGALFGLSDL
jgi:hypothetical protein